ncbi:hypothetical protein BDV93DRAFT_547794 [Ceratobasidium sp. AG-I]|nr:hypothetical protein BDV93DRAFT_547794 [Ceratobasidium sp. AG-I]
MIPAPHFNSDWYSYSVSRTLRSLALKGREILPAELYQVIEEAAGRVYIHESYVNDLQSITLPGIPIHADPFFVFTGYKNALSNLMKFISQSSNHADAFCLHTCNQLSWHLHQMLAVLRAQGMDNYRMYQDPAFINLMSAFELVF